jgi:hypothetical protein
MRKPTRYDLILKSARDAQQFLQQFISVPFGDPIRATQLLNEFERAVEEFKRLRSQAPAKKARVLRLADARAPRRCAICGQRVVRRKRDYLEIDGSVYHQACRQGDGLSRLGQTTRR